MKCPQCGQWNRDTFPVCIKCGCELKKSEAVQEHSWKEEIDKVGPSKTYIQVDEAGRQTAAADERDKVAYEMRSLQMRKERGEEEQRRLVDLGAVQGFASSTRNLQTYEGRSNPHAHLEYMEIVEPVAQRGSSSGTHVDYDDYENTKQKPIRLKKSKDFGAYSKRGRRYHSNFSRLMRRFGLLFCVIALVAGAVLAAFKLPIFSAVSGEGDEEKRTIAQQIFGIGNNDEPTVEIVSSILDEMPAHTIRIPGPQGASIWVGGSIRKSYSVIGGYAVVEIPDYIWYSDEQGVEQEKIEVTIEPYLKTKAGEQEKMDTIQYTVEVPESPLVLITPDTGYAKTNDDRYTLRFRVDKNSTVKVNDNDYTSYINTLQDGEVNITLDIQPQHENKFVIETSCRYYRKNVKTVIIDRDPVTINIHLDKTMSDRSVEKVMQVRGSTLPGANLVVKSKYQNLDLSQMAASGDFSFEAIFDKIGDNEIIIQVSSDLVSEPTIYTKTIYYMPPAKEYSQMAWSMNKDYDYSDYLNQTELRIKKTQVYVCRGVITEIISSNPQLAIMELSDTADASGKNARKVMLENKSTETWVVGNLYRIFADAYGTYNSYPRLTARYTYIVKTE